MASNFVICLIFVLIIYKVNAQAPTVPTAGPTLTTIFTIPTPSTITQSSTIPSAPTLLSTTSLNMVTTTTTGSSLSCPPNGIYHLPTSNCQTFIVCVYGRPHEGSCSDGTLFDSLTSSCLPAANVDCGTRYRP